MNVIKQRKEARSFFYYRARNVTSFTCAGVEIRNKMALNAMNIPQKGMFTFYKDSHFSYLQV